MGKLQLIQVLDMEDILPCPLCGCTSRDLVAAYPGRDHGAYIADKLLRHLGDVHGIETWVEFAEEHMEVDWPRCPKRGVHTAPRVNGRGVFASTFSKGGATRENSVAIREMCSRMSEARSGPGNPMFGREAWNAGKTKEMDPRVASISRKLTGRRVSEKTKRKQSEARAESPLKARHTTPHTAKSKQKMREATAARHKRGEFGRARDTAIEVKMAQSLEELGVEFDPQFSHRGFVFDFYLPQLNTVIECDGDFFHCNPDKYPEGPVSVIQERNVRNDKRKNYVARNSGLRLLRLWESDIMKVNFSEILWKLLRS